MARKGRIFFFGLVLFFFIRSSLIGGQETRGAYFTQVAFHKLEGNSLRTFAVRSLLQCCMRCERIHECLSVNVPVLPNKNGLYECVLLKNGAKKSSKTLVPSRDHHHYTRFKKPSIRPTEKIQCKPGVPLGMESGAIPDNHITASSVSSRQYLPANGRLNMKVSQDYTNLGTWKAARNDQNQWLQVDLGKVTKVTGIATQGDPRRNMYVSKYSLQYSVDGLNFQDYEGGKILSGNSDQSTVVKNALKPPINARYIKVRPKEWYFSIAMRMELYKCA